MQQTPDALANIVYDRDSLLLDASIAPYIKTARCVEITGTALSFVIKNKSLWAALCDAAAANHPLYFLLADPRSPIVASRDRGEGWNGRLADSIRTTAKELLGLQTKYPEAVCVQLFTGEIHNTTLATDKTIIINPYAFGRKGPATPAFIFERARAPASVLAFAAQYGQMCDSRDAQNRPLATRLRHPHQLDAP